MVPADGAIYDSQAWFKTLIGEMALSISRHLLPLLDAHDRHTRPVLVTGNHPFVGIQALASVPSELAKLTERGAGSRLRSR